MAAEIGSDTGLFSSNIEVFVLVHKLEILCQVFFVSADQFRLVQIRFRSMLNYHIKIN